MLKSVKRNKRRDFESFEARYWRQLKKKIDRSMAQSSLFIKLEKAGKIVWMPSQDNRLARLGLDMLTAYRKSDVRFRKPLMHKYKIDKEA